MNPKLSVIIPVYNCEKTIEKCINSIIDQTLNDIEIIVINDCSTDHTLEILKQYENIILIENKNNCGPAASRNKGLDIAKGQYIGFVDGDDTIHPKMYETMISYMNDEVDLVACSRINVTKDGNKPIINKNKCNDPKQFTKSSNYNCDKVFKKEIIDKYHLRLPVQYKYAEDFLFNIKYKYYANKMVILEEPFYYYLFDSENSITNTYSTHIFDIIYALQDAIDFFKGQNEFEKYKDELLQVCIGFYIRRIKEFRKYRNYKLQKEFVSKFLTFFKNNFKKYKHAINTYKTKYYKFYRSSYVFMLIYIFVVGGKHEL